MNEYIKLYTLYVDIKNKKGLNLTDYDDAGGSSSGDGRLAHSNIFPQFWWPTLEFNFFYILFLSSVII